MQLLLLRPRHIRLLDLIDLVWRSCLIQLGTWRRHDGGLKIQQLGWVISTEVVVHGSWRNHRWEKSRLRCCKLIILLHVHPLHQTQTRKNRACRILHSKVVSQPRHGSLKSILYFRFIIWHPWLFEKLGSEKRRRTYIERSYNRFNFPH